MSNALSNVVKFSVSLDRARASQPIRPTWQRTISDEAGELKRSAVILPFTRPGAKLERLPQRPHGRGMFADPL